MTVRFYAVQKASKKPRSKVKRSAAARRTEALAKQMANVVQVDLVKGIKRFKRRISRDALKDAYERGDYRDLIASVPWRKLPEDLEPVMQRIKSLSKDTAYYHLGTLQKNVNPSLRYDISNPQTRKFLNNQTASLVTRIEDDTRQVIRDAVTRKFTHFETPEQVADRIKGSIGLLPQHERAVARYYDKMIADGFSRKQAEAAAGQYEDRLLDYRANMIARSEVARATNYQQLEVWREAQRQGYVSDPRKVWVVDGDPCEICEPMDGEIVGLDESWQVEYPDGSIVNVEIPPLVHPHCMCNFEVVYSTEGV